MNNKTIWEPVCFGCKHFFYYPFCRAFVEGIPKDIRMGKNDHTEPYPDDNGIRFEPIEKGS